MPLPNLVTKKETMASSCSQELPWLRELAMVSPLVTRLGRGIAKSQFSSDIEKSREPMSAGDGGGSNDKSQSAASASVQTMGCYFFLLRLYMERRD